MAPRSAPLALPLCVLALAVSAIACDPVPQVPQSQTGLGSATSTDPVRFEVTGGSAGAQTVTYGVNGNQAQETETDLPWAKEVPADGFAVSSLVAQNAGGGEIKCRITRGGEVLVEQTSRGRYAVVTCSA